MTLLGKFIITLGICIFTVATITWIITTDWRWFAGGGTIFVGATITAIVVSIETKDSPTMKSRSGPKFYSAQQQQEWRPPDEPPPDQQDDPFLRP